MKNISQLTNLNHNSNNYLLCPTDNCFNVPEILYNFNPLKSEVKYKCNCNANYDKSISTNLQVFLEKANIIICRECNKIIKDTNVFFCKSCKKIIHCNCGNSHNNNYNHSDFETIEKDSLLNCCKYHRSCYIFRCLNCNESLCSKCDLNFHNKENHKLRQIMDYNINQKELENINYIFEKQKNILEKIKEINNNLIETFENDIKIKQRIINSYIDNIYDYCSKINLKNLYIKNNEKYENIISNILTNINSNEEKEKNISDIDNIVDKILLPFYYMMMINKDESINDSLINNMDIKISKLKNTIINQINNFNSFNKNKADFNFSEISNINFDIKEANESQKYSSNLGISYNNKNSTIQKEENNELSLFSNINDLNNLNINYIQIKDESTDKIKNKKIKSSEKKNKNMSEKKKLKQEGKKKEKTSKNYEQDNYFLNNMVALKSGNFAISIQRRVEIYDFRKLNYNEERDTFDDNLIKNSQCLLQKINFDKGSKGKFINYIFQFVDETLLCSIYSKIIRIRLINNDEKHEIIGYINLENMELCRKLISLGNSLLVILSEKKDDCYIKIFEKNNEILKAKQNDLNIISNEIDSICQTFGIINNLNNINNNYEKNEIINNNKENIGSSDINKENQSENIFNIKEDPDFKIVENNINVDNKLWVSMLEIKKSFNENNSYEFVATSNADLKTGGDKIIFYNIKKIFGEYKITGKKEIEGISCSCEPDTLCQINEKYICVGLQDFERNNQKNGFALIDIFKRELHQIIEDGPISSLYYIKEKNLLMATLEIIEKKRYFETKLYKVIKNNDIFEFNNINKYKNNQSDVITSCNSIILPNMNKHIICITSTQSSHLEIVKAKIEN